MRVLSIINSLGVGGAEQNLVRIAARLAGSGIEISILPIRKGGALRVQAEAAGVGLLPGGIGSLLKCWLRPQAPVVEGWLYGGAVVASLFALRGCTVVWNLRHVPTDLADESLATRTCLRLMRVLPQPRRIHVNSQAAQARHEMLGIQGEYRILRNGIDTTRFRHDPVSARDFRTAVGVPAASPLVVHVGRAHPHKGHPLLFAAMARLLQAQPDLHLACIGPGTPALAARAASAGLVASRVHFVDALPDVVGALSAARVVVNPSSTESSPTALAEAMSCGAVCVATDVGDSAAMLGDAGWIVPVDDPRALADALRSALALSDTQRAEVGARARRRIVAEYDAQNCLDAYARSIGELAEVG